MAKRNVPDAASGAPAPLVIETGRVGYWATGTAEQIVSAGLCVPSQFPPGRKRSGLVDLPDGSHLCFERQKGGMWRVHFHWPKEKRDEIALSRMQRKEKQERLDALHTDGEAWKAKQLRKFSAYADLNMSLMTSECGWRFSFKAQREVESLMRRIRVALLNADVELNERMREKYVAANAVNEGGERLPMPRPSHLRMAYSAVSLPRLQS